MITKNIKLEIMEKIIEGQAHNNQRPNFNITEVIMPGVVEPAGLLIKNREINNPAAGQVIIKVEASGISFAEQAMRRDRYHGQPKFPFVPGYDLVGTVEATGDGVDPSIIGKRYAVLTKTGAWATMVTVDAEDLLPVPHNIDSADAEALVVNGITGWQMLHRKAKIRKGQTILVQGANGGVGTILVQLAQNAGVKVIGTAAPRHHAALRLQGVEPIDYNDPDLRGKVLSLAPEGVDAVFDNVGLSTVSVSFGLLKPGGTLVSYANASALKGKNSVVFPFLILLCKVLWWNILPNGKTAIFYNIWAGKGSESFRPHMREDFANITKLLSQGALQAKIAGKFPLTQVVKAMEFAESRTAYGKVILQPNLEIV
jgi:NADPH:quinone reductase-like Zn-dependent oxidoreductase